MISENPTKTDFHTEYSIIYHNTKISISKRSTVSHVLKFTCNIAWPVANKSVNVERKVVNKAGKKERFKLTVFIAGLVNYYRHRSLTGPLRTVRNVQPLFFLVLSSRRTYPQLGTTIKIEIENFNRCLLCRWKIFRRISNMKFKYFVLCYILFYYIVHGKYIVLYAINKILRFQDLRL